MSRGNRSPTAVWIRKRKGVNGPSYGLRWIDPRTGKETTEPCGSDLTLARQMREAKRSKLREGLSGKLPDKSLSDLKEALGGFLSGKAAGTLADSRRSLQRLLDVAGDLRLEHVDKATIMEFRARRLASGASLATVNKDLRQIKSALSYAVDAGWLRDNPLYRWKGMAMREPEKRIRVIEPEEFQRILESCNDPIFRVLLKVGYLQGLRRRELVNLRWDAVDLESGVLRVENRPEHGEFTKSRKNRTIPMAPAIRTELSKMFEVASKVVEGGSAKPKIPHVFTRDGKPFPPMWVTRRFNRLVAGLGIAPATIHDLRRSFSTLAQRAGVDKYTVKDLGGWSSVGVVEKHYTGEISTVLKTAMERIAAAQAG